MLVKKKHKVATCWIHCDFCFPRPEKGLRQCRPWYTIDKLYIYNINGKGWKLFYIYLFNGQQCVYYTYMQSETHYIKCSVSNGSLLGR